MRYITAAQALAIIRNRTEIGSDTDGFVSDTELLSYLNASIAETHGIIVSKNGGQYFRYLFTIQIVPGQDTYALPWDFWKILKVRYNMGSGQFQPMLRYEEMQEDMYSAGLAPALMGSLTSRYREQNNQIKFIPGPQLATMQVQVWYAPQCPVLVLGTQATRFVGSTTTGMGITYKGIYAGLDGTGITHQTPAGATTSIVLSTRHTFVYPKVGETNAGVLNAIANSASAGIIRGDIVGDPNDVVIADAGGNCTGSAGTVGITDWDGFNGWEEVAVTDCCIKVAIKNRADPAGFMAQKRALVERIEMEAENRDQGQVHTGIDTYGMDQYPFGFQPGWMGAP